MQTYEINLWKDKVVVEKIVKHFEGDRDQVRRQAVLFTLQGVNDFVSEL